MTTHGVETKLFKTNLNGMIAEFLINSEEVVDPTTLTRWVDGLIADYPHITNWVFDCQSLGAKNAYHWDLSISTNGRTPTRKPSIKKSLGVHHYGD